MKKKLRVLLSILGVSTLAVMGAGCSAGDSIKTGIDQLFCKHEYSEFTVTKDATCYEEGEQERTCDKCGKVDKEEILTLDHTPTVLFGGKDATCTEVGYFPGVKCAVEDCGAVIQKPEKIPAHGHTPYAIESKAVSCFEDGYTEGVGCRICNEVIEGCEVIQAPNVHTWVETVLTPATCVEVGVSGGVKCSVCGYIGSGNTTLPLVAHNYSSGECTMCGGSESFYNVVSTGCETKAVSGEDIAVGRTYRIERGKSLVLYGLTSSGATASYDVIDGKLNYLGKTYNIFKYCYYDGFYYVRIPDGNLVIYDSLFAGSVNLFDGGNYYVSPNCGAVEVILPVESLAVSISSGNYENVLTEQENGLHTFTFAGVGDYVRSSAVALAKGETLVCDFSMQIDNMTSNNWFGVVFGDGTDSASYPNDRFGMRYYDWTAGRYMVGGEVLGYDGTKTISSIMPTDGQVYDYRIKLSYNQDGTYSYYLSRKHTDALVYSIVDSYLNFECPTPSSLMLCALNQAFTLTDLVFYKAV